MPNVVMLMADEHNPFYTSVYGHPSVRTPNMERLARMGTVFQNAYCVSPSCMASRSAFLAGKPPHQTQVYNNCNVFPFDYASYGRVLGEQGVHTVLIGRTDAWNRPETLGFTEMLLPLDRSVPGDTKIRRAPLDIRRGAETRANGFGPKEDAFVNDRAFIDRGIEWLTEIAPGLDKPWTLSINIEAPHFPHYVTEELWDLYPDGGDLPVHGKEEESANHPYARDLREHFRCDLFTEEQIRGLRRGYLGCVTFVDEQLGRLLDTLEKCGRLHDTIVVYTADHGEMLGKFGMWWKCSLYEDSVRVPLIAAGPGFRRDARVSTPVSHLDLQASMFKAVGKIRPRDWWGSPLQEIQGNPEVYADRAVFAEYHGHGVRSGAYMVRKGPWKLMYNMDAPHQLFDLASDPHELSNAADREPSVFASLVKELRTFCCPEAENERAHAFVERQLEAVAALKR